MPLLSRASFAAGPDAAIATLVAGEPGDRSILLQARIARAIPAPGDVHAPSPGLEGSVRFEISQKADFSKSRFSAWTALTADNDFIGRVAIKDLAPATHYFYRAHYKSPVGHVATPPATGKFMTLSAASDSASVSLAIISCMSYELFFGLGHGYMSGAWSAPAQGVARQRGYPALDHLRQSGSQFMIATGDTVYYDHPASNKELWAHSIPEMRQKWHCQFALPAVRDTLASCGTFFMKDDHDFRFDDGDNTMPGSPTPEEGRKVFLEQAPVLDREGLTYRTVRINRHLQIWLLEGRDYRSANAAPDDDKKTMWGTEQREWLERTLLESDANFKLIISPTPIVGPDDARKRDNQASEPGFKVEGSQFLQFLRDHDLATSTFIMNGDRHWKYHSIDASGVEEFSCGTVHRQNSRFGVAPGDARGTDPDRTITQPYLQPVPDGGYIQVDVEPDVQAGQATMLLRFWGEDGTLQYAVRRWGKRPAMRRGPNGMKGDQGLEPTGAL